MGNSSGSLCVVAEGDAGSSREHFGVPVLISKPLSALFWTCRCSGMLSWLSYSLPAPYHLTPLEIFFHTAGWKTQFFQVVFFFLLWKSLLTVFKQRPGCTHIPTSSPHSLPSCVPCCRALSPTTPGTKPPWSSQGSDKTSDVPASCF